MAPEYGATRGFFPADMDTLGYLALGVTFRIQWLKKVPKHRACSVLPITNSIFTSKLSLKLEDIRPSLAGPKPQRPCSNGRHGG